eukprot:10437401-Ditylum_brightwellii.AAC.1
MADLRYPSSDLSASSNNACSTHTIKWEASIHGEITTEPNAGRLPIKDVNVAYSLLDKNMVPVNCKGCSGTTSTTAGGMFEISFNVDNVALYGSSENEYAVDILYKKTSKSDNGTDIPHKFLCNEGEDDCSDTGHLVYLNHLNFKKPVEVYDDTNVPFSGKVFVADTDKRCMMPNVEVCLTQERKIGGVARTNETL